MEKRVRSTPGKHNAVFPLFLNNTMRGTSFSFDSCRVLSARHNVFPPNVIGSLSQEDKIHILVGTEQIEMVVESTPNPAVGKTLADCDDWIILRRVDNYPFRTTIIVKPTEPNVLIESRPHVTIYHFPSDLQTTINIPHNVVSSSNRIIGCFQGKVNCNDLSNISGGSCGGPYVDNVSGGAFGLHIEGVNSYGGAGYKLLVEAMSLVPVGLHFDTSSTLIAELKAMKVLI